MASTPTPPNKRKKIRRFRNKQRGNRIEKTENPHRKKKNFLQPRPNKHNPKGEVFRNFALFPETNTDDGVGSNLHRHQCSSCPLGRGPLLTLPSQGSGQILELGASAVSVGHSVPPPASVLCGPPTHRVLAEGKRDGSKATFLAQLHGMRSRCAIALGWHVVDVHCATEVAVRAVLDCLLHCGPPCCDDP